MGFYGNIPRWGFSQLGISLVSSDLVILETYLLRLKHIWTHLKLFHGNIPRWGISQLGISLVSTDLVFFSIN